DRKQKPARGTIENDVAAFRIDARHAPSSGRGAYVHRVEFDGIGVMAVHMLDDLGLRLDETLGAFGLHQEIAGREIEDASEAADVMRAVDSKPPKGEVGKVGVEGSLRVAREKSPPNPFFRI